MTARAGKSQRGAALIIVLLLVSTLSFILLSVTNIVSASVSRSASDRSRAELLWRAASAEEIARSILKKAAGPTAPPSMVKGQGLFADQLELPFENGKGAIVFADATRCFNLNSLVAASGSGYTKATAEMANFVTLAEAVGLGGGDAQSLADVIVDFLDTDVPQEPQGAEDGFYTGLPTPFRTADGPIASVSELRAMDGVNRTVYRRLKPYLCALGDQTPPVVNLNMLEPGDAPIVAALTAGKWEVAAIKSQIAAMPPGGWAAAADFWKPFIDAGGVAPATPTAIASDRINVFLRLEVNDRTMEETLLFEISSGDVKLLARTFGDEF